jgi:hypothetical protein
VVGKGAISGLSLKLIIDDKKLYRTKKYKCISFLLRGKVYVIKSRSRNVS